ncbi:hypothetical protein SEVIR_3G324445v4 [Setaria viridis]
MLIFLVLWRQLPDNGAWQRAPLQRGARQRAPRQGCLRRPFLPPATELQPRCSGPSPARRQQGWRWPFLSQTRAHVAAGSPVEGARDGPSSLGEGAAASVWGLLPRWATAWRDARGNRGCGGMTGARCGMREAPTLRTSRTWEAPTSGAGVVGPARVYGGGEDGRVLVADRRKRGGGDRSGRRRRLEPRE